jgi:hypothetical protein
MKKRRLLLAVVSITANLCAGCNFIAAPQRNQPSCPAVAGSLANIEPKDLSADARGYLTRYSLPITDADALCQYLERIQHDHEMKVEEGVLDMMGDYFLTTQKIETGYYFTYKIGFPDREIPRIILDRTSSESEQVDLFLKAIDSDPDAARKALFEKQLKDLSPSNRKEAAVRLIQLLFKKSWVFNSTAQQYVGSENYHDDSYGFVDRGLRTTSYAHMGTTLDWFFNQSTLNAAKTLLPEKATRILIVGPGLDLSDPELGEEVPQQSYEPFAILDILLKSRRANFENLKIDLFDISPRVIEYWTNLLKSADENRPSKLMLVSGTAMLRGGNESSNEFTTSYVAHFGDSLPGVTFENSTKQSRRPAPRTLDPYAVSLRTLTIPAAVLKKFHPFQGDLTTTNLEQLALNNGGKYDLIFCFNTMEYLNESERALAGINVRNALAQHGVFITDNRFETDLGERPQDPQQNTSSAKPIFERSFFEMAADVTAVTGRHVVIYRMN